MKIYFIRHGATRGNREHRYVGRTDEGILESEKERLRERGRLLPEPEGMFVSPSRRCLETARALFPEVFSQKEMAQEELAVLEQARCVLKEAGIL